jgi:hypothetical protein
MSNPWSDSWETLLPVAQGGKHKDPPSLRPQSRRDGPDPWATPLCLIGALVEDVLPLLPPGVVWEPACGAGGIAEALRAAGRRVIATDAYADNPAARYDFLADAPPHGALASVISNPPFNQIDAFTRRGLELLDAGTIASVVWLYRWDHLTAAGRTPALDRAAEIRLCTWRPRWIAETTTGPRWSFCWITWRAGHAGPPVHARTRRRSPA